MQTLVLFVVAILTQACSGTSGTSSMTSLAAFAKSKKL